MPRFFAYASLVVSLLLNATLIVSSTIIRPKIVLTIAGSSGDSGFMMHVLRKGVP